MAVVADFFCVKKIEIKRGRVSLDEYGCSAGRIKFFEKSLDAMVVVMVHFSKLAL